MPELPEVEIGARNLLRWSAGRTVTRAHVLDPRSVRGALSSNPRELLEDGEQALRALVEGQPCGELLRHGKRVVWRFGSGGLLLHLGMTGKWVRRGDEAPAHAKVSLGLDDGHTLYFVDPRLFGCVVPLDAAGIAPALSDGLGPDALEPLAPAVLGERLRGRRAVKVALMDQAVLAGLGNIHAAEALFFAGIDPRTRCQDLGAAQLERLAVEVPAQLRRSLTEEGEGEITYLHEGKAQSPFRVYGREDQPCVRCGTAVQRFIQGGRSTFWCPGCQSG